MKKETKKKFNDDLSRVITACNEVQEFAYQVGYGIFGKKIEVGIIRILEEIKGGGMDNISDLLDEKDNKIDELEKEISDLEDEAADGETTEIICSIGTINYRTDDMANQQLMESFAKCAQSIPPFQLMAMLDNLSKDTYKGF